MTTCAMLHSTAEWAAHFGASEQALQRGAVVSIGNFDGMHLGHQKILRAVVDRARELQAVATVITFDPHPAQGACGQRRLRHWCARSRRDLRASPRLGIEAALVLRFDAALAARSPEEFVREFLAR